MKNTKLIALTGILSALSVVLMFFGSIVSVFTYVMPLITGLLMIILNDFSRRYSVIMFAVVGLISIFALPDKECALTYIFFFGYYPIIRESINKIKSKAVCCIVKLLIYNAGIVSSQLLCFYVFKIPFDDMFGKWGIAVLLLLANLVFAVYERLFSLMLLLYQRKLKKTIIKILKY